jgi:hypothetical protein
MSLHRGCCYEGGLILASYSNWDRYGWVYSLIAIIQIGRCSHSDRYLSQDYHEGLDKLAFCSCARQYTTTDSTSYLRN